MAKQKIKEVILRDCNKCMESIKQNDELHCKLKIRDLKLPFTCYSEVKVKRECQNYREIK